METTYSPMPDRDTPGAAWFQVYLAAAVNQPPAAEVAQYWVGQVVEAVGESLSVQVGDNVIVDPVVEQFPEGWQFEPGDVVGVAVSGDRLELLPHMAAVEISRSTRTFWVENARTSNRRPIGRNVFV